MIFIPHVREYMSRAEPLPQTVPHGYTVAPDSRLDDVVLDMAEREISVARVVDDGGLTLGVFTAFDGLRALGEILRREETVVGVNHDTCGLGG